MNAAQRSQLAAKNGRSSWLSRLRKYPDLIQRMSKNGKRGQQVQKSLYGQTFANAVKRSPRGMVPGTKRPKNSKQTRTRSGDVISPATFYGSTVPTPAGATYRG